MVRTQLQLDNDTYEALREIAHRQRKSMSAVVRDILRESLSLQESTHIPLQDKYQFIACEKAGRDDLSIRHDEVLAEDFQ